MSFLIDTETCSAHLKQKGIVSNRFLQYTGGLHISTITLGELTLATHNTRDYENIRGLRLVDWMAP
jgi:predicted nucleic acid-binding protein